MGTSSSKIRDNDLPVEVIIRRMDECVLPDEREIVLDYMEMLEGMHHSHSCPLLVFLSISTILVAHQQTAYRKATSSGKEAW